MHKKISNKKFSRKIIYIKIVMLVFLQVLFSSAVYAQNVGYECRMTEFGNLDDRAVPPTMTCEAKPTDASIPEILVNGSRPSSSDKQRLDYIIQMDVEMFIRSLMLGAVPDYFIDAPMVTSASQLRSEQTPEDQQKGDCPVMYSTGEKLYSETDFQDTGEMPLTVSRTFRSMAVNYLSKNERGIFGHGWSSELDMHLRFVYTNGDSCPQLVDKYPNARCYSNSLLSHINLIHRGYQESFVTSERGAFRPKGNIVSSRLIEFKSGSNSNNYTWQYTDENGVRYIFNDAGRLLKKTNVHGISWSFVYEPSSGVDGAGLDLLDGKLKEVVHSSGRKISLGWEKKGVMVIERPIGDDLIYPMYALDYVELPNGKKINYEQAPVDSVTTGKIVYPEDTGEKTYSLRINHGSIYLDAVLIDGVQATEYGYYSLSNKVEFSGLVNGVNRSSYQYTDTETVVTNAKGGVTTYKYDDKKRLTNVDRNSSDVCPSLASRISYSSSKGDNIDYREDWSGNRTSYSYYDLTYKGGSITAATEKVKYEYKNGVTTEFIWDDYGRLIRKYIWDGAKELSLCKAGSACPAPKSIPTVVYQYVYDSSSGYKNRIKQVRSKALKHNGSEYTSERVVNYSYQFHANNLPSKITIDGTYVGSSDIATIEYNSHGRVVKTTNSLGHATNYQYNISTSEIKDRTIDPNGLIIDLVYDARGRLKATVLNDGSEKTTRYEYYADNQLKKITYPNGGYTSYGLDLSRRVNSIKRPDDLYLEHETVIAYDLLNNPETVKNYYVNASTRSLSTVSQDNEYDQFGNLSKVKGQAGQYVSFSYGVDGKIETALDAQGRTISFVYDLAGNLESVTNESTNETTEYRYDSLGYLSEVVDPRKNVTRYYRNGFGEVEKLISPDTGTTSYTYTEQGFIDYLTRENGVSINYTYDYLGRIASIQTSGGAVNEQITYYYDALPAGATVIGCGFGKGRLCKIEDSSGTTTFRYDKYGRVTGKQSIVGGSSFVITYSYDQFGRLDETTYPDNTRTKFVYNISNDVKKILVMLQGQSVWKTLVDRTNFHNYQRYTYGNGIIDNRKHDFDGRITSINSSVQDVIYSYKPKTDLIESITNNINPAANASYSYDDSDRIYAAPSLYGSATIEKYFYDDNGNRIKTELGALSPVVYKTESSSNRLLARYQGGNGSSYAYDDVGNLISKSNATFDGNGNVVSSSNIYQYEYDSLGRMNLVKRPSTKEARYYYNGLHQKVRVHRPSGPWSGTPIDIKSVYDMSGRLSWELSYVAGASTTQSVYIYLDGQIVGMVRDNKIYYIHGDHLDRPEVITDANKTIMWRAKNGTFDRLVQTNNFNRSSFNIGFPGQYYDSESQFWYNWHRYYDASTGRYTQSDPIGLLGGENTYVYTDSNPTNYIDPLGLHFQKLELAEGHMRRETLEYAENGTPHIGLVYEGAGWKWELENIFGNHSSAEKYEVTQATSIMTTSGIGTPTNIGGFTEFGGFGKRINTIFIAYGKRSRIDKASVIAYAKMLSRKTGAKVYWFLGEESGCEDAAK